MLPHTGNSPQNPDMTPNAATNFPYPSSASFYNPCEAKVECFGIELAIKNKDLATLQFLWSDQQGKWEEAHFAFVLDKVLEEDWDQGMAKIFRSPTSHVIFKSLNAEDKDNFLYSKILDKVTAQEYWENNVSPIKVSDKSLEKVINYLRERPYGGYAVLKYPNYFE